jgi:hypothetical protein
LQLVSASRVPITFDEREEAMVLGMILGALGAAVFLLAIDRALRAIAVTPVVWHDDYERRLVSGRRTWPLE